MTPEEENYMKNLKFMSEKQRKEYELLTKIREVR